RSTEPGNSVVVRLPFQGLYGGGVLRAGLLPIAKSLVLRSEAQCRSIPICTGCFAGTAQTFKSRLSCLCVTGSRCIRELFLRFSVVTNGFVLLRDLQSHPLGRRRDHFGRRRAHLGWTSLEHRRVHTSAVDAGTNNQRCCCERR